MSKNSRNKKYNNLLKSFKFELRVLCQDSPAHCMAIINAYKAYSTHSLFGWVRYHIAINHRKVSKELQDKYYGKCLCGSFGILGTLAFIAPELTEKYKRLIPEKKLLGGSVAVAYQEMNKMRVTK
jgi:hypothetical protein